MYILKLSNQGMKSLEGYLSVNILSNCLYKLIPTVYFWSSSDASPILGTQCYFFSHVFYSPNLQSKK